MVWPSTYSFARHQHYTLHSLPSLLRRGSMERSLWNPLCKVTAGAKDERSIEWLPPPSSPPLSFLRLHSLSGASVEEKVQSTEPDIVFALAFVCWRHFNLLHRFNGPLKRANQLSTVSTLLYRFLSCWCLKKSTFYVVYQPCSFACILVIFLADKVSSTSYVGLQHYRWRSFAYFTFTLIKLMFLKHG